jgi:hypothetical protein
VTDFHGKVLEEIKAPFAGEILYVIGTPPISKENRWRMSDRPPRVLSNEIHSGSAGVGGGGSSAAGDRGVIVVAPAACQAPTYCPAAGQAPAARSCIKDGLRSIIAAAFARFRSAAVSPRAFSNAARPS